MAETKDSQENLAYIRTHVDNLERMVRFQISANPQSRKLIEESLSQRPGMAEVYLALATPKTQEELKAELNLSQPTISRILKELYEAGMVEKMPSLVDRKKMAYRWTDLEQMLDVSRLAQNYLNEKAKVKPKGKPKSELAGDPGKPKYEPAGDSGKPKSESVSDPPTEL